MVIKLLLKSYVFRCSSKIDRLVDSIQCFTVMDSLNARDFLQDLKTEFGNITPLNESLGAGLDGFVRLHKLEENGVKRKVAIKTATKPIQCESEVEQNAWRL